MIEGSRWRNIEYGADGRAHVRVTDSIVGTVIVVMPESRVGTPEGEEIIARALETRSAAHEAVHGEGS